MPVHQLNAPVGLLRDIRVVRHHQNRVPSAVQLSEQPDYDLFIRLVQIACWLICQDQLRLVDQRPRNRHALLFAAGEL